MRDISELTTGVVAELLNAMNTGVYLTDRDRRIVFWNRRAEEITGYSPERVVGSRCSDNILMHLDTEGRPMCNSGLCPLNRSMTTDSPSNAPVVVYAKTASGERIPLSTSVAPIHNEQGEVIGGVEVFRDERQNMLQMKLARAVQQQMLIDVFPADDRISFDVEYSPVDVIGGDFYHVEQVSDDVFSMVVLDIEGHGTSAALYTTLMHSLIHECVDQMGEPATFMSALNVRLCSRVPQTGLMTAACTSIDVASRTATYCSAGHPAALFQPGDGGEVSIVEFLGYPLGLDVETAYASTGFPVDRGGRLLLYTDGAVEIKTDANSRLGSHGLASLLAELPPQGTDHRLEQLYASLLKRCSTPMPEDDITLLSCIML
jgi:sigma-B regulation protein RsbU (phosphoserine phosphatase)